jgi:hypothetical protein
MDIDFPAGGSRPGRLLLGFFALVGFLASVVTIAQFFRSDDSSSLSVIVTQHKFQIPYYSGKALQSNQPARLLGEDLRKELCKGLSDDLVLKTEYNEISEKFGDKADTISTCKKAQDLEFSARWTGEYSSSDFALYEYIIKNDGNKPADGMRLQSSDLNTAQYSTDEKNFVELKKKDGESFYSLPTLNPGESLTVLAWSNTPFFNTSFQEWNDLPTITYAGAIIHTEFMKNVPDGWYNAFDFISSIPWILLFIFVSAIAFAIVLIFAGVIGLVQVIATGKTFSEVFSSDEKSIAAADKSD